MLLKGSETILSTEYFRTVPMQEIHVDELARLESCCFSEPWTRSGLVAEFMNDTACFVVAEPVDQPGAVAGYAGMHYVAGEGYIDNVAVFPELRKKGVGRLLMNSLFKVCRERGAALLSLEVREGNAPAISLYSSLGFQEVGKRRNFYSNPTEDALILTHFFLPQAEKDIPGQR